MSGDTNPSLRPQPDQLTIDRQRLAAHPRQSAWVSANAGSGKTYVLSTRVIRLLLDRVDPSKILCLTYTKTAAAEMKTRVFSRLGEWVTMEDDALAVALSQIVDTRISDADIAFARTLFARALETPGGLKIQTIHAFCEALLHRFPLEANIAGHFELIDDMASALLVSEARSRLLTDASQSASQAVQRLLTTFGEASFHVLLDEIINQRQALSVLFDTIGHSEADRRLTYYTAFDFGIDNPRHELLSAVWPLPGLTQTYCRDTLAALPTSGTKTAAGLLGTLAAFYDGSKKIPELPLLASKFLNKDGAIKSSTNVASKGVLTVAPDIADRFNEAALHIQHISDRLKFLDEIDQTLDALTIANELISLYGGLKDRRGLLDFDDLIARTERMLNKENIAAWVRYKLDQGIDHILVDEAQDTSPAQWRVIKTLAEEFFAGEGARDVDRSVFAVGDEKQSIYSFQGADPAEFLRARDHFAQKLKGADKRFNSPVELEASFRSTHDILAAVDKVFAFADHRKGLAPVNQNAQTHRSLRAGQPGRVEVWDVEKAETSDPEEDWTLPVDHAAKPAVVVANRIANTIRDWLSNGERLEATGEKIRAGDILVLVRKRDAFVHALSKALKELEIPVAGSDRLKMTQHIAVLDLMALGRVMLNQHDDLSLAAVLRSPMFAWSDEQLFELAHGRGSNTMYSRLLDNAHQQHVADAYESLERWRSAALNSAVFEFYSYVLTECGGREKLVARLGSETSDMLDEFLNYAIAQEQTGPSALETFVHVLDNFVPEIKREMQGDRDEIRIMTVHGAKGLEAPVVFLVDPGTPPASNKTSMLIPLEIPNGINNPIDGFLCKARGDDKSQITNLIIAKRKELEAEEYSRLLYVGMTRAADRLIVAGYAGVKGGGDDTWSEMVERSLEAHSLEIDYPDFSALRYPAEQALPSHMPVETDEFAQENAIDVPVCFSAPAPKEPPAPRPLVPSGASGLAVEVARSDSDGEVPASLLDHFSEKAGTGSTMPSLAAKRGTLVHKLLQMLPDIDRAERKARALQYCRLNDHRWTDHDIKVIADQVINVIDHPDYAEFFSQNAFAEISVMGTVEIGGEPRAVSGVIDRLSVTDEHVYIIDYKTNANPPRHLSEVPSVYLRQMALYHALVAPLYEGKSVRTALLFTARPQIIEIDARTLENALASIPPGR